MIRNFGAWRLISGTRKHLIRSVRTSKRMCVGLSFDLSGRLLRSVMLTLFHFAYLPFVNFIKMTQLFGQLVTH